ncbi:MAG: gliding motility-associated C-terminal domain-containing protein [Flavobacteriales bacterium]
MTPIIRKGLKAFLSSFAFLLLWQGSQAQLTIITSKIAGGNISYTHVNGDTFSVSAEFYVECGETVTQLLTSVGVRPCGSNSPTATATMAVTLVSSAEITTSCGSTTCSGGSFPGRKKYLYSATFIDTMAAGCWELYAVGFTRNTTVNVSVNGNNSLQIKAEYNQVVDSTNSSAKFLTTETPYICAGQSQTYDPQVIDTDGDSLLFLLDTTVRHIGSLPMPYAAGFSALAPIPGITIDASTGVLNFTAPATAGNYQVTIRVEEYDKTTGFFKGSSLKDFQFIVPSGGCSNTAPVANASLMNLSGSATLDANYEVTLTTGTNGCFELAFVDPNAGDTLELDITGIAASMPGSVVDTFYFGDSAIVQVCWNATAGDVGTYIIIPSVTDNKCPVEGTTSKAITVNVVAATGPFSIDSIAFTDETCDGSDDGTITVITSGGTGPFTYMLEFFAPFQDSIIQNNGNFTDLPPTFYNVYAIDQGTNDTIIDGSGVFITPGVTMLFNPSQKFNQIVKSCFGDSTGDARANIIPVVGNPPTFFAWDNGETTQKALNLSPGFHVVTVTRSLCVRIDSVNILENSALLLDTIITTPLCNGNANGQIDLSVSGGTTAYSYLWNGGQTTQDRTGLAAGTYTVTVTDAITCTSSMTVVMSQPAALVLNIPSKTDPTCPGASDGTATASPSGGTVAIDYTYSWSNGDVTATADSLAAGTYTVTVTDDNGCTITSSVTLVDPAALTITLTPTHVACNGDSTGAITASGAVSYVWSNGGTTATITNLPAGMYTVTATSGVCTAVDSVEITEPATAIAMVSIDSTDETCFGAGDGAVTATASGGTGAITYLWNPGALSGQTQNSLNAGTYTVTASDANGCTVTASTVVNAPAAVVSVSIIDSGDVTCNGDADGFAEAGNASGGTAPYDYTWNSGQTTQLITGLSGGTFIVTAEDANGCQAVDSVTIDEPLAVGASASALLHETCATNDGQATVTVTNAVGVPTFLWSNTDFTQTITGLDAGNYTVTVTDGNGCTATSSTTVLDTCTCSLDVTATLANDVLCNGDATGKAFASTTGGTAPITFAWNFNDGIQDDTLFNVVAGTYTVTATDLNGCTDTASVVISQPATALVATATAFPTCVVGVDSVVASGSGGTGAYLFGWNTGATTSSIINQGAGTYSVTITDALGCTDSASATLGTSGALTMITATDSTSCNGDSDGSASVAPAGGVAPYTFLWSTTSTNDTILNVSAGNYTVTATDFNGCQGVAIATVGEPAVLVADINLDSVVGCNGKLGGLTANQSGGTANYSYLWSTTATTQTLTGLSAGTYTVTITDANGCQDSDAQVVGVATAVDLSYNVLNPTCKTGPPNGRIAAFGTPSSSLNTFLWSDGSTNDTLSGLDTGLYSVTITDSNNCQDSAVVPIIAYDNPIELTFDVINESCAGNGDGLIVVSFSGGVAPLTIEWFDGTTNDTLANLNGGVFYDVTITDFTGCEEPGGDSVAVDPDIALAVNMVQPSCNGDSDGKIFITPSGQKSTVSYTWDPAVSAVDSAVSLSAGSYKVTVSDDSTGCSVDTTLALAEPAVLAINMDSTAPDCGGASTGTVTGHVTGGTQPYTFTWSNNGALNDSIDTALVAGTYTVTVTDANGCTISGSASISSPTSVVASITSTNPLCNSQTNGTATANGTGGTGTYSFGWDYLGATSQTISSLAPGTYAVTVTDGNGCTDSASVIITDPAVLLVNVTGNSPQCNGDTTGSAIATPSGGTTPYTFLWSTTETTDSIGGLSAGTYTVTVTDSNGCTATGFAIIANPTVLSVAMSSSNNDCFGDSTGSATANASGGTGAYSFDWSNGVVGAVGDPNTINTLPAGTYTVTVSDANGCQVIDSVTLTQPTAISIVFAGDTAVECNGDATADIIATGSGGTGVITYAWNTGATTQFLFNVAAGTYTVTATDGNGCTAVDSIIISEPAVVVASALLDSNASCNGAADGGATASGAGGTPGYTFGWNNGATSASLAGVVAGTYSVTITDVNGCTDSASVTISQPTALVATATLDSNAACNGGSTGGATATEAGGTGPYAYLWSNAATTASITGVVAGTYSVTITDVNSCTDSASVTISEPTALVATATLDSNAGCNGTATGGATATEAGGTGPYTYLWSNAATTASITGVVAGTYSVTITDANSCTDSASVTISEPTALVATATLDSNAGCNGTATGGATATEAGGTGPYTYLWSNAATTASITGVVAGTYSVTITDANNCTDSASVTISEPTALVATATLDSNASCNGTATGGATAAETGGTGPYTYLWSNTATTASISGVAAGTYSVTITDANSCTDSASVVISEPAALVATATLDSNASCNGTATGGATATETGGTGPYAYFWSNAATTASITGVVAGTYSVTVTDASNCTDSASVVISEPALMTVAANILALDSCDNSTGSAQAVVTNGTGLIQFLWNNLATTQTITGLDSGLYEVTVTDANGCTDSASVLVGDTCECSGNAVVTITQPVSCFGGSDGELVCDWPAGIGPFTQVWVTGATTDTISNLVSGTYVVTMTDANGCTDTASATMTDPTAISFSAFTGITQVSCDDACDGAATANASGGTGALNYAWSSGATTQAASSLCGGGHTITVTDANNCTATTILGLVEPPSIWVVLDSIDSSHCGNADGEAFLRAFGGFAASTSTTSYIVDQTEGEFEPYPKGQPLNATNYQTLTLQDDANSAAISIFGSGSFQFFGQNKTQFVISSQGLITFDLSQVSTGQVNGMFSTTNAIPFNGTTQDPRDFIGGYWEDLDPSVGNCTIETYVLGTTPNRVRVVNYINIDHFGSGGPGDESTFQIALYETSNIIQIHSDSLRSDGGNHVQGIENAAENSAFAVTGRNNSNFNATNDYVAFIPSQQNFTFTWSSVGSGSSSTNLPPGTYTVTASNGVCFDDTTFTIPSTLNTVVATITVDQDILCGSAPNTGELSAAGSGGQAPYTFEWSTTSTNDTIFNLTAGTYSVTVTDANGCTDSTSVLLTAPAVIAFNAFSSITEVSCDDACDGAATANATGGTGLLSYAWSNGDITAAAAALCGGTHTVTVTDQNGCTDSAMFALVEPPSIYISLDSTDSASCGGSDGKAFLSAHGGFATSTSTATYIVDQTEGEFEPYGIGQPLNATNYQSFTLGDDALSGVVNIGFNFEFFGNTQTAFRISSNGIIQFPGGTSNQWANVAIPNPTVPNNWIGLWDDLNPGAITNEIIETYLIGTAPNRVRVINYVNVPHFTQNSARFTFQIVLNETSNIAQLFTTNAPSVAGDNSPGKTFGMENASGSAGAPVPGRNPLAAATAVTNDYVAFIPSTQNFAFTWSSVGSGSSSTALPPGTYTVTASNGVCSDDTTFTIEEKASNLAANLTVLQGVSCTAPSNTGELTVAPTGGTGPYDALWSTGSTADTISNLFTGTYTVTVSDANGCEDSAQVTLANISTSIASPTILTSDTSICSGDTFTLNGVTNATATFTASTSTICTSTFGGQVLLVFSNVPATAVGNGTLTITAAGDLNDFGILNKDLIIMNESGTSSGTFEGSTTHCASSSEGFTISQANINTWAGDNVVVFTLGHSLFVGIGGLCSGNLYCASATLSFPTTPDTSYWFADPLNLDTALAIGSGNTVDVSTTAATSFYYSTFNGLCWSEPDTVDVGILPVLTPSITQNTNIACPGDSASLTAAGAGGSGTYAFEWPAGETTATANYPAGTWCVTVTDVNGNSCPDTACITLVDPTGFTVDADSTPITCNGGSDGTASANAVGTGLTFLWSTGQTSATIGSLSAGVYTVTVTATGGCEIIDSTEVTEPAAIDPNLTSLANGVCGAGATGTLTSAPTGGDGGPYSFQWSGTASTNDTISGLAAGTYTVTVTDNSGCTASEQADIFPTSSTITMPTVLTADTSVCPGTALTLSGSNTSTAYTATTDTTCSSGGGGGILNINFSNTPGNAIGTGTLETRDMGDLSSVFEFLEVFDENSILMDTLQGGNLPFFFACDWVTDSTIDVSSAQINTWSANSSITFTYDANPAVGAFCEGGTVAYCVISTLSYTTSDAGLFWFEGTFTADTNDAIGEGTSLNVTPTVTTTYFYANFNGECWSTPDTVVVTILPALTASVVETTPPSCTGDSALLNASASGGTGTYTFLWPGGETTASVLKPAGSYCVTIDDGICTDTACITVVDPTPVSATFADVLPTCPGGADGAITASGTGGAGSYTYQWVAVNNATNPNLSAGTYTVTVTDANGCTGSASHVLLDPAGMSATFSNIGPSGCVNCTGDATVNVTGNTGALSYSWPSAETTVSATSLCDGNNLVTVTDNGTGCIDSFNVFIPSDSADTVLAFGTDPTCNGGSNGMVFTTNTCNNGCSFVWIDSASGLTVGTTDTVTGLPAGTYIVQLTNAGGCVDADTVSLGEPTAVDVSITASTPVSCLGGSDGTASASANGGTGVITYAWPGGINGQNIGGLSAGTYVVTATDANGCTDTASVVITQPATGLTVVATTDSNASCNGLNDGGVSALAAGGTGTVTYQWNGGVQFGPTWSGLPAGDYIVIASDLSGCTATDTATVTEPTVVLGAIDSTTNPSCFGLTDGEATVHGTGGTPGYTYTWASGGTGTTETNLGDGIHCVTIADANGCEGILCVTITEPGTMTNTFTGIVGATCGLCDGVAVANPSNGNGLPYTYAWDNGGSTDTNNTLCAGVNTVTITDSAGCELIDAIGVSNIGADTVEADSIDASCGACDGQAIASYTCTGCTVEWFELGSATVIGTADTITGLCEGTYFVELTNGSGCISTAETFVNSPDVIDPNDTVSNESCAGAGDGSITLNPTGGSGGFVYNWSNTTANTPNNTGLSAGTYTVTISDVAGCDTVITFVITAPSSISLNEIISDASCFGACDGEIALNPSGGATPYSYNWNPVPGNGQGVQIAMGLCAGDYEVTVTDLNGCTASDTLTVDEPAAIVQTAVTVTDATCGVCDGSISPTFVGGAGGFTFEWSNTATTQNIGSLCFGLYSVTVTDISSCTESFDYPVSETDGPEIILTGTNPTANGACDGEVSVAVVTSQGAVTFAWSTGSTNDTITGLCAGQYVVTATDINGCSTVDTITLIDPALMTISIAVSDITCAAGGCDGQAIALVSGGVAPYTFAWNTGNSNDTISALCAGTYTVTVTDNNGVQVVDSVTLVDPTPFTVTVVSSNQSCIDVCDGTIDLTITGSMVASITWNTGDTTASLDSLCAGTYVVTIVDTSGCEQIVSIGIISPPALSLNVVNMIEPDCQAFNGSIEVAAGGGSGGAYSYNWLDAQMNALIPAQTTSTAVNLFAGIYNVAVEDINGCPDTFTVILNNNNAPDITLDSIHNVSCFGACDGMVEISLTGGTLPYTFIWSSGGTAEDDINVCAGADTLTVADSNLCLAFDIYEITEPTELVITSISATSVLCGKDCDGVATVTATGGNLPYTFSWSNGSIDTNATGLCAGTYTVTITDGNGCTVVDSAQVFGPEALTLVLDSTDSATCDYTGDGSIYVTVGGGTPPYAYNWVSADGLTTLSGADLTNVTAGNYGLTVTDLNGCTISGTYTIGVITRVIANAGPDIIVCPKTRGIQVVGVDSFATSVRWLDHRGVVQTKTHEVELAATRDTNIFVFEAKNGLCVASDTLLVLQTPGPGIDAGPDHTIEPGGEVVIGGSPTANAGVSVTWTPAQDLSSVSEENPLAFPLKTTVYYVSGTDADGCFGIDSMILTVENLVDPVGGFSPNGDGVNDYFYIDKIDRYPNAVVSIVNRWGNQLFVSNPGYTNPWNGTFNGKALPVGTYYYIIDLNEPSVTSELITGPVTILK